MSLSHAMLLLGSSYIAAGSRGDEVTLDPVLKASPGVSEAITAAQDWLFLTGPSPLVASRAWLRPLFIFGLATVAMILQIRSALAILKRGMNHLSKLDDQVAPEPMSPAAFHAAAEEAASLQRQRLAEHRRRCLAPQSSVRRARSVPRPSPVKVEPRPRARSAER
ncbi:unnamed protein product [Symbiodinium sp. CCMP2592]|nr:unnamed protein product [Symbiodinium sp. CCMP2592]